MVGAATRLRPQTGGTEFDESKAVADACDALWLASPDLSARHVITRSQATWLVAALVAALLFIAAAPGPALAVVKAAAWVVFVGTVVLRAAAAGALLASQTRTEKRWLGPLPRYTILCPMRREPESVASLAEALRRLDYPSELLDVKFVLEADDRVTIEAARAVAPDFHIVETPPCAPRTKPKALNYAMAFAEGEFVCVYDAEDRPHPRQLRAALDAFAAADARLAVVQAPLLIDNGGRHWLARQFEAEYAVHFLGVQPLLARLNLHPALGGTSNHFRRAALEEAGLWDPYNVTEDADLGYRLAIRGWRIGSISLPTFEEAPVSVHAWIAQRSRWIKGYMQTWLVIMRRPGTALHRLGAGGFFAMHITLMGSVVASLSHAPACALLVLSLAQRHTPASVDVGLLLAGYAAGVAGVVTSAAVRRSPRILLAALTLPFYWPLGLVAGLRALHDLIMRPHYWSKTDHGRSARETPIRWE